jgi:hypothetical protein
MKRLYRVYDIYWREWFVNATSFGNAGEIVGKKTKQDPKRFQRIQKVEVFG